MTEPSFKITQVSPTEMWGTAQFSVSTMNSDVNGVVSFKIIEINGKKQLHVLDPFGGQNAQWLAGITGVLEIDLTLKKLL
jgi:hypothetical protein